MNGDHIPVLLDDVLRGLAVAPGAQVIDGTLGAGGHSEAILTASAPDGRVLGFDRDPEALRVARVRLAEYGDRLQSVHASYAAMGDIAPSAGFAQVDGVLLDLGLSSLQLGEAGRGFAFSLDGPLDMRFDTSAASATAADLVNSWPEEQLADVLFRYGEERRSRRIVRAIVAARPVRTTRALAEVVARAAPARRGDRIHPATRTFQALRVAVNDELGELEGALPQAVELLKEGGRLVVISFHSLEDRIVKQFMRREEKGCICPPEQPVCTCEHEPLLRIITRKPIRAGEHEIDANPRARSAKLRVAERV